MKKIILTGAALLAFAAAGLAQNTATLSQAGTSQNSTQAQSGNALTSTVTQGNGTDASINTLNKALTDQRGLNHSATVTQNGNADNNNAIVKQTGGGATVNTTDGNQAIILQQNNSGGTNGMRVTTFGKDATAGRGNYAEIMQDTKNNAAKIEQSDNSSSNYGQISQTDVNNSNAGGAPGGNSYIKQNDNSSGNAALIEQPGQENVGRVDQNTRSFQNEAAIRQIGDNNVGEVKQQFDSRLNTASIDQSGSVLKATVSQEVTSTQNQARLVQDGTRNTGVIEQQTNSGGTGAGEGNVADLYQNGSNNILTRIEQNSGSTSNKAYLNQYGNNNNQTRITQSDNSSGNTARIDQGGDGREKFPPPPRPGDQFDTYIPVNNGTAIIEQSNTSRNNEARIGQSGNGHNARIYQNGEVSSSKAFIDQFPAADGNNTGLITQTNSTLSSARITQNAGTFPGAAGTGNNRAEVYQGSAAYGPSSGNVTTVVQENGGNISRNEQFGTNNLMEIDQRGNRNLVTGPAGVYANGIAHQEGSTNKAFITQVAGTAANIASLFQSGSNNTATINQNNGVAP